MSTRRTGEDDLCCYCSKRPASSVNHIFARKFFLEPRRASLPQAPACDPCNKEKSRLEHYLSTAVRFGGKHVHGLEKLLTLAGRNTPFNGAGLERLFTLFARGLMWHHWKVYLNDGIHLSRCFVLTRTATGFFDEVFFRSNSREHVSDVLRNGAFRYDGEQAGDDPALTIWRFSVYGRSLLPDNAEPGAAQTEIIVITGST